MKWENYKKHFIKEAKKESRSEDYILRCLEYAIKLFEKDLPIIYDQYHLSLLVGYDYDYLLKVSNCAELFYRQFFIPKKNGDLRKISEPLPNLKQIQKWILEEILYKIEVSEYAKAFQKGKSIKDNARFHRNQKKVLTVDIEKFFDSISHQEVLKVFIGLGYAKGIAVMLTNLCCLKKQLPQGGITSPALSNIIMRAIDKRIVGFTKKSNIRYSRYADDMTFSGDISEGKIINFVSFALASKNLYLNPKKTRVMGQNKKQEITGIVVNRKMQASRDYRREIRKEIYFIKKFGLNSHLDKIKCTKSNYLKHLLGKVNFALFVNPKDSELKDYFEYLKQLLTN